MIRPCQSIGRLFLTLIFISAANGLHADEFWGKITLYPFFTSLVPDYLGTEVPIAFEIGSGHFSCLTEIGWSFESNGTPNSSILFGSIGGRLYSSSGGYGGFIGLYPVYRCIAGEWNDPTAKIWNAAAELGGEFNFNIPLGIALYVLEIYHDVPGSPYFFPNIGISFAYRINPIFPR